MFLSWVHLYPKWCRALSPKQKVRRDFEKAEVNPTAPVLYLSNRTISNTAWNTDQKKHASKVLL
jgi:hypothetical protein